MADMVQNKQTKIKRVLVGRVVSNKMDKTIVVKTERVYSHPLLKKTVRSFKKYKVHDADQIAKEGDMVEIIEGRPVSKTKFMYIQRVIESDRL